MRVRHILHDPHPLLRVSSREIFEITDDIRVLAQDMIQTVRAHRGIGLAAPQVGVDLRMILIDISYRHDEGDNPLILINPEIVWCSKETKRLAEGCLSLPGVVIDKMRPSRVRVRFTNMMGEQEEREFSHLWAACVQHEIDHLNGILINSPPQMSG